MMRDTTMTMGVVMSIEHGHDDEKGRCRRGAAMKLVSVLRA